MRQVARSLTDPEDGFLTDMSFVIMDRDDKFCPAFRAMLADSDIEPIRLPARSPNLNAYAERFIRSIKEECIDRMIFFGYGSLQRAAALSRLAHSSPITHVRLPSRPPQFPSICVSYQRPAVIRSGLSFWTVRPPKEEQAGSLRHPW